MSLFLADNLQEEVACIGGEASLRESAVVVGRDDRLVEMELEVFKGESAGEEIASVARILSRQSSPLQPIVSASLIKPHELTIEEYQCR